MIRVPVVLLLVIHAGASTVSDAQPADSSRAPLATLAGWVDDLWLTVLDRDGSYFGRLSPHGAFQRFNPLMTSDYESNVWTGRFSPGEDARWATVRQGIRAVGASLSHPHLLSQIDWRDDISISRSVDLVARYVRDHSLTAMRDLARIGVRWRGIAGTPWDGTFDATVQFFKPTADLELVAARRWGDTTTSWSLDLRFAMPDAFNNVVFNALHVRPEEHDSRIDYTTLPFAARASLVRQAQGWRGELHAGSSTPSTADVSFPASGAPSFTLDEQVTFAGVLGEATIARSLSASAFVATARATTDRTGGANPLDDVQQRERTTLAGGRARYTLRHAHALEVDYRATKRPEDGRDSTGATAHHDDDEQMLFAALVRAPVTGWTWRVALGWFDRDAGPLATHLSGSHRRSLIESGYRFATGFDVSAGTRWNLDHVSTVLFSGGHVRVSASW